MWWPTSLPNAELGKALVERMAEAGIVVGPTLATIENTLGEPGGAAVAGDSRLAEALGDAWARRLNSAASGWHGRQMPPYSRAEDNVRRLADAGVTLLAGTDAPNPGTVFGASLHRELELLVRCGATPAQALAAPRLNRHECSASPTEDVSPPGSARTWSSCPATR